MNLSLPVNQTRQCPLVISKVTKWKWKMCLLRHCFDFERVRHATWLVLLHNCEKKYACSQSDPTFKHKNDLKQHFLNT